MLSLARHEARLDTFEEPAGIVRVFDLKLRMHNHEE